jgi:AhpD family alkylhydroperoxidase
MSHIPPSPGTRYPWYVRLLFSLQRRRYGRELEPARLWGRTPRVFLAMAAMYGALDRRSSPLDPALRAMVQIRVSQINACAFCVDINSATLLERGATREKLDALPWWADSPLFDEREKAVLAYADAMTRSDQAPNAATVERLRQWFSDDQVIELTALIGFQNMSSKFNAALGVPAQGFCRLPPHAANGSIPGKRV